MSGAPLEDAIIDRLKELRRELLYAAYPEAPNDPEYAAEMAEITREFHCAVADGLGDATRGNQGRAEPTTGSVPG